MTTVEAVQKDVYTELMMTVEAGNVRRAVSMVLDLPDRNAQLDMLWWLAHAQAFALEQALERALVVAYDFDHIRSIDLDQANAEALARDLAHDYAYVFDHAYTQANTLEKSLVRNTPRDLDTIFACARDVDHAFARARERALYLDRDTHINKTIIGCLHALMYDGMS